MYIESFSVVVVCLQLLLVAAEVVVFVNKNTTTWKHVHVALSHCIINYIILEQQPRQCLPIYKINNGENAECSNILLKAYSIVLGKVIDDAYLAGFLAPFSIAKRILRICFVECPASDRHNIIWCVPAWLIFNPPVTSSINREAASFQAPTSENSRATTTTTAVVVASLVKRRRAM